MNSPLDNLKALLEKDKVIPVIGAGVSYAAANLPGWKAAIEHGLRFAEGYRLESDRIDAARKQLDGGCLIEGAEIMKAVLRAPEHPYSNWLKTLFGSPAILSSKLLDSIEDLCAPILLTTNYDELLSNRSPLRTRKVFDWSDYEEVLGELSRDPRFVLHLHGIWNKPKTVILSQSDYSDLANILGYKEILKKLWSDYHFLFIGCSRDGVMDEDFSTVFNFLNEWFPGHSHQHFILLNEREIQKKTHLPLLEKCNIAPISYGDDHNRLPEFINFLNPNRQRARQIAENLKKEIDAQVTRLALSDEKYSASESDTYQFIKSVLPRGGSWIDSLQLKILEEALREKNNRIQDRRNQFQFYQSVVKALVKIGELESQIQLWIENSGNASALNNDKFINLAIICYECLQRLPEDLLEEIRHRSPGAIHSYYFDGYLGQFVHEYRAFKGLLRNDYDRDNYFFENLKRIIESLLGFLELDADVIFPNVTPALIAPQIETPGWLFVCHQEISLRKSIFPYDRMAGLPVQGRLIFIGAEIIRFQDEWVVVTFNSQKCFRWHPTKHLAAEEFFEAPKGKSIRKCFVTEKSQDKVVVIVYCGSALHTFINFKAIKETRLLINFWDIVYHSTCNAFIGFVSAGSFSAVPILYRVDMDGNCQPLIHPDTIWDAIKHLPICKEPSFDMGEEFPMQPSVDARLMRLRMWGDREVVVLKLRLLRQVSDTDVLAFIDVGKKVPEFLALVVLPGRLCIAFDLIQQADTIDLVCGYLATGKYPKYLVQWIKGIDLVRAIQADDSYGYIETGVLSKFDIYDVLNHSVDRVFVNQPRNDMLYDLNLSDGSFNMIHFNGLMSIQPF